MGLPESCHICTLPSGSCRQCQEDRKREEDILRPNGHDIFASLVNEMHPVDLDVDAIRDYNVGDSDYASHKIQPWDIWLEYQLNPWDADIIKRVLRNKESTTRKLDYEKIIHISKERIRQIEAEDGKQEDRPSSGQSVQSLHREGSEERDSDTLYPCVAHGCSGR